MITTKPGVDLVHIRSPLSDALRSIELLWMAFFPGDVDGLTITSGAEGSPSDGVHLPTSFHYQGLAMDLRVRDVDGRRVRTRFLPALALLLGREYDIVWEKDHVHVEFDPKQHTIQA